MTQYTLGTININDQAKQFISQILDSKRLSYGYFCQKLEKDFAKIHSCSEGIVCNSGTSALHTILSALKIKYQWQDQDEIIVPSVTFVATINAVLLTNLKPVLVDVDPQTYNLNPDLIQAKISPKTKAILPVHLFGQPAAMTKISAIAKKNNLKIIEDCCETIAAKHQNKSVGSWGKAAAFSTYSAHVLATGIGGIITTNDNNLATLMRSLINHGRDSAYLSIDDDENVSSAELENIINKRFSFNQVGFSYRLSELEAAIGLAQLNNLKSLINKRIKNVDYLNQELKSLTKFIQLPLVEEKSKNVFMAYPLVLKPLALKEVKNCLTNLIYFLEKNQIETRPLMPLINQPSIKKLNIKLTDYPVAQNLLKSGFYVGCHQDLTKQDLDYFVATIKKFFKQNVAN